MREGGKQLQRLGLAAVLVLAASATQALGQTNPVCGVPAALGDGWAIDSLIASASTARGCAASPTG